MNAAAARLLDLDAVADNLANIETPGFRATRPVFEAVVAAPNDQKDLGAQVHVMARSEGVDVSSGPAIETGSPMDIRLADGAWLGVALDDGSVGFTRDGRLSVGVDGVVRAGAYAVVDDAGAAVVVPASSSVRISDRGEVIVDGDVAARLGQHALTGPLTRVRPTVLAPEIGSTVVPVDAPVQVGVREGSSVSGIESTISMIGAQRAYDEAMQAIQTAQRLDEKASEVGRLRG
jgi:flagellar basal-body rod protein FlgF